MSSHRAEREALIQVRLNSTSNEMAAAVVGWQGRLDSPMLRAEYEAAVRLLMNKAEQRRIAAFNQWWNSPARRAAAYAGCMGRRRSGWFERQAANAIG